MGLQTKCLSEEALTLVVRTRDLTPLSSHSRPAFTAPLPEPAAFSIASKAFSVFFKPDSGVLWYAFDLKPDPHYFGYSHGFVICLNIWSLFLLLFYFFLDFISGGFQFFYMKI